MTFSLGYCHWVCFAFSLNRFVVFFRPFFWFGFISRQHTNLCVLCLHTEWFGLQHQKLYWCRDTSIILSLPYAPPIFLVPFCSFLLSIFLSFFRILSCISFICIIFVMSFSCFAKKNTRAKVGATKNSSHFIVIVVRWQAICTCFSTWNFLLLWFCSFQHASLSYAIFLILFRCRHL